MSISPRQTDVPSATVWVIRRSLPPLNKCGTILESKVLQAENLLPGTPFTENPLMIHVKDDIIKAKLPPRSVACISISLVE